MVKIALIAACLLLFASCTTSTQPADTPITFNDTSPTATNTAVLPLPSTQTPTIEITPTLINTSTQALTITPTETLEITATIEPVSRPSSHLIAPITGERQAYALSCESRAAVDWAGYYGFSILEADFQFNLPFSDNPDYGFVGVTTGRWGQVPPYDYGVHAAPVAELLREYGVPAVAVKNFDLESLRDIIAQDHPIIAWVIGNVEGGVPHIYIDSQGNQVTVAAYEHTVIVIGYDDETETITYMNNGQYYETPASVFENSWSVLEYMAIYHEDGIQP